MKLRPACRWCQLTWNLPLWIMALALAWATPGAWKLLWVGMGLLLTRYREARKGGER